MNSDEPIDISAVAPDLPSFSDEQVRECHESGDYRPILFEWYKFVAALANIIAHVQRQSEAFNEIPLVHFHILVGLLNRCARLMLSNVALSHEGKFGETTAIVDRCIFETAVKIIWLCTDAGDEKFVRYLSDSLKPELEFKTVIASNIKARNGQTLKIEERMLRSIDRCISSSGLSETAIRAGSRLPDAASLLAAIDFDRVSYIATHRMGSHHVHGTWPGLLFHYLEEIDGTDPVEFAPRGPCPTHMNQFIYIPLFVLEALATYVSHALRPNAAKPWEELFAFTWEAIWGVQLEAVDGDLGS